MKLALGYKLAIALLGLNIIIVTIASLLTFQGMKQGFLTYLNEGELKRAHNLKKRITRNYSRYNHWGFMTQKQWKKYFSPPPHQRGRKKPPRRPHHITINEIAALADGTQTHPGESPRHYSLLDADYKPIIGTYQKLPDEQHLSIIFDGKTIGYLQVEPFSKITGALGKQFVNQQIITTLWIAGIALVLSILCAILLAYYLRKRLHPLTHIAETLTQGHYGTQTSIQQNDELADLGHTLNHLSTTLDHNKTSQRQWIADISHELRTPLAVLQGELDALEEGVRPITSQAIESLSHETQHLSKLVNDLYQLAISDIGALKYQWSDISLHEIVTESLYIFTERAQQQSIQLSYHCDEALPPIQGDSNRLQQLIANLLENSIRYTQAPGTIQIECQSTPSGVQLIVQDSSPSVPNEQLPHLFKRLHRVENSRNRKTGGAGLGLSIAQAITEAHHGEISANHSLLGGLKIIVQFPESKG